MAHALAMGTRDAMLLFHAGMIDAALGRRDSARRHLETALAINPALASVPAGGARARCDRLARPRRWEESLIGVDELLAFVGLGFHHIADLAALDHVLFLLALAAIYRGRDWRAASGSSPRSPSAIRSPWRSRSPAR